MKKHHEDLMIGIINAAMAKCSDCFNPDFEVFKRDLGGIFASVVQARLMKLTQAHENDNDYPINQMTQILSECTWEFTRKIDNIVYQALDAAEKSFCNDMEALSGTMSELIANESKITA